MINNRIQAYHLVNKLNVDLSLGKMENLIPQYLRSGIEVFSHQIYASTFAISNPFVKGFVLADEAGLGKTMEALLIISQYYTSKQNVLVIVPSTTIDNWLRDIVMTFDFRCVVLDSTERPINSNYAQSLDRFDRGIVLTSYDYILSNPDVFKKFEWQLCVLDEAHRFRTYKIKENKTANTVLEIVPNAKKILLTATPIQKNEDDIFGLINFIDEGIFTDYNEFHKRYFRKPENYPELRDIIAPYMFRTLRNQVKLETQLPERQILTQIYQMTDKEQQLYSLIEKYVAKEKRQAFPEMEPYELSLMLYGTLSSSPYALSKTLAGIYTRLMKNAIEENVKEAQEIKEMLELATSIQQNNKDELLIKALDKSFSAFYKKGFNKKCVIFTQNTQSQEHIEKLLMQNTDYSIFTFNGTTNNEPIQKFLLNEKPSVLISTDKGNESLNWQNSCFVINYDFPQVLLDMEQRISRCHRIGQKCDVFVINFICPNNFYDVRMYELFYKRTNISNNIIGASDAIISGAIDGNIETNIEDTLNNVRKKKEVQIDFSEISEQFKNELEDVKAQSNDMLFNTFDKNLVEKTKNMAEIIKRKVNELSSTIQDLARYYFQKDMISENVFEYMTSWHNKNPYAAAFKYSIIPNDEYKAFNFGSEPCQKMLNDLSNSYNLSPLKLTLKNKEFKDLKGYIACYETTVNFGFHSTSKKYLVGIDESGKIIDNDTCDKLLCLDCEHSEELEIPNDISSKLDDLYKGIEPSIIEPLKLELDKSAELPIAHIKMLGENEKNKFAKEIEVLQREINKIKNENANNSYAEQLAKNQKINDLTEKYYELKDNEFFEKSRINKEVKSKIEDFYKKYELKTSNKKRFMLYFEVKE